jgi:hypothetical protein
MLALAAAAALALTPSSVFAQKGNGGAKGPKVKVTQPAPKATAGGAMKTQGPKTSHGPKASPGPKTTKTMTAAAPKTKTHGKGAATTTVASTKTKTTKSKGPHTTTTTTTSTTKTTKGPDRTSTTTTIGSSDASVTLSPVQQKLKRNTNLAAKLEGRLPAGTNLMTAAEGFRNLGQFVAAVNVSNNLGISFTELKTRMVDDGMSLGQAIKAERNDVNATSVALRAERDAQVIIADADVKPTTTTTTTTTTSSTTKTKPKTKTPKPAKSGG